MRKGIKETVSVRAVSVGLAVLALAVFKPFGLEMWQWQGYVHLLVIMGLGLGVCVLSEGVLTFLLRMPHSFGRGIAYIIRRNLWFQVVNTPLEALMICLYRHFLLSDRLPSNLLSWANYLETLVIIVFCSFFIGLYWRFKFRSRFLALELEETLRMNEQLKQLTERLQQEAIHEEEGQGEVTSTEGERTSAGERPSAPDPVAEGNKTTEGNKSTEGNPTSEGERSADMMWTSPGARAASEEPKTEATPKAEEKPRLATTAVTLTGTTSEVVTLMVRNLLYVEAVGNYVKVCHLKDEKVREDMLRATSKQMEEELECYPLIVRCHRAFLVNLAQVERIVSKSGNMQLRMKQKGNFIPVSRSNVAHVKEALNRMTQE